MTARKRGRPAREQPDAAGPFALAVRARRLHLGWTQAELAEKAGVGLRAISYYEAGREPYLTAALAVAEALGLSLDRLAAAKRTRTEKHR